MKQNTALAIVFAVFAVTGVAAASMHFVPTSGTVPVADENAPVVYVTGGKDIDMENGFGPDPNTTTVDTNSGSIAVSGPDGGKVTVDQMEGTYTNLSDIDTAGGRIRANPGDKPAIVFNDGVDSVNYRNGSIDNGQTNLIYSASSSANISIGGLPAGEGVGAVNASSGDLLDNAEVDSAGRVIFDDLPSGEHTVVIQKKPQSLLIRNESNPSEQVTNANVEIRFFVAGDSGNTQSYTRSTSSGEIDMTGLPANKSFIVEASASGYSDRQIFVDNLYEQRSIYLINDTVPQVTKIFDYSDFSGQYPQEDTVLIFQRAIGGQFQTVQGDVIGATGEYRVNLEQGQRYQLVIFNRDTGQRRIQGPYQAVTSGTQEIEIYSDNSIEITSLGPILQFRPSTGAVSATQTTFETEITRRNQDIDSATVTLYRRSNGQLTQIMSNTTNGAGKVTQPANLSGYSGATAVVEIEYEMSDGTTDTIYRNYTIREQFDNPNSLLSTLGGFADVLPDGDVTAFQSVTAILISLLTAAAASSRARLSGEGFGVVMVASMAGWSVIGWIQYGLVFAAGVALSALIWVRRGP